MKILLAGVFLIAAGFCQLDGVTAGATNVSEPIVLFDPNEERVSGSHWAIKSRTFCQTRDFQSIANGNREWLTRLRRIIARAEK